MSAVSSENPVQTTTFSVPEDAPEVPKAPGPAALREAVVQQAAQHEPQVPQAAPQPVAEAPAADSATSAPTPPSESTTPPSPAEDIERILPNPGEPFALESGLQVVANPLKLRELLALLKIITRGAAIALGELNFNSTDSNFQQQMISLFIFAIPEAEDEAADFIRLMVRPAGPFADEDARVAAQIKLDEELLNPSLEDLFSIIEIVIHNEGGDLRRLGKRLMNTIAFAQKTGQ